MAQKTILSSTAPIKWGAVDRAFNDINDNFGELYQAVSLGLNPESLGSSLIPSISNSYDLGTGTNRWRDLYLSGTTLYLGNSTLSSNIDGSLALPAGSTVQGQSIVLANSTQSLSIIGSDSTLLVDSATSTITGPIENSVSNVKITGGALGQLLSTDGQGVLSFIDPPITGAVTLSELDDTLISDLIAGQVLQWNGSGWINGQSTADVGDLTFTEATVNTVDNGPITFSPEVIVNNSASVSGTLTVNNVNITGEINSQGSGTPEIFSDNEILLTAGTRVEISSSPLKMASFTTVERDLLAAINGDVIYNTSLNKFQGYANGSWVDFH